MEVTKAEVELRPQRALPCGLAVPPRRVVQVLPCAVAFVKAVPEVRLRVGVACLRGCEQPTDRLSRISPHANAIPQPERQVVLGSG